MQEYKQAQKYKQLTLDEYKENSGKYRFIRITANNGTIYRLYDAKLASGIVLGVLQEPVVVRTPLSEVKTFYVERISTSKTVDGILGTSIIISAVIFVDAMIGLSSISWL